MKHGSICTGQRPSDARGSPRPVTAAARLINAHRRCCSERRCTNPRDVWTDLCISAPPEPELLSGALPNVMRGKIKLVWDQQSRATDGGSAVRRVRCRYSDPLLGEESCQRMIKNRMIETQDLVLLWRGRSCCKLLLMLAGGHATLVRMAFSSIFSSMLCFKVIKWPYLWVQLNTTT